MYQRTIRTLPLIVKIPAGLVLVLSVIAFTQKPLIGLLFTLVALFALTFQEGVQVDFVRRRIRIFTGLLGLKTGKWEILSAVERLTLVPVRKTYRVYGSRTGSSSTYEEDVFEVRLYPNTSNDFYIVSVGTYETVNKDAHFLAQQLQVAYEDFTKA